ncbi:MAG: HupE/UreJ family protein [Deltaproteobacteria bacterium]|nr:HupE/UreJ family protein [Deltaproteobacteria bacterium]
MARRLALAVALVCALVTLLFTEVAGAHGMRTAYIELRERAEGRIDVTVRAGSTYGTVRVSMPAGCTADGGHGEITTWSCRGPLRGSELRVEGLGGVVAEAVVVAIPSDGATISALVRPGASSWVVPEASSLAPLVARYGRAGFLHVLGGADHLLFLAALVVAIRRFRAVVLAETAFTLSHSIALAATTLGFIHVPAAVAEAAIALSLVLVAIDLGRRPLAPWAGARTALVFGAVHGLGFAGGLEELGVPRDAIAPALGGFAMGIEVAQVAFLLVCFALTALAKRVALEGRLAVATAYAVGVTGCFWLFDRVAVLAALR